MSARQLRNSKIQSIRSIKKYLQQLAFILILLFISINVMSTLFYKKQLEDAHHQKMSQLIIIKVNDLLAKQKEWMFKPRIGS